MKKQGAWFAFDWPHLNPCTIYYFPGDKTEQKRQEEFLIKNRKELSEELSPFVKKEMEFFAYTDSQGHPYAQESANGITVYLDYGGRSFKLGIDAGNAGKIVMGHHLDYFPNRAVAFNTASKLVEMLNPEIDTPKILHDEKKTLYYPLPKGLQLLPQENGKAKLTPEWIQSLYNHMKVGDADVSLTPSYQRIDNKYGNIFIRDGIMEMSPTAGHKEFSWICSKLMYLVQ